MTENQRQHRPLVSGFAVSILVLSLLALPRLAEAQSVRGFKNQSVGNSTVGGRYGASASMSKGNYTGSISTGGNVNANILGQTVNVVGAGISGTANGRGSDPRRPRVPSASATAYLSMAGDFRSTPITYLAIAHELGFEFETELANFKKLVVVWGVPVVLEARLSLHAELQFSVDVLPMDAQVGYTGTFRGGAIGSLSAGVGMSGVELVTLSADLLFGTLAVQGSQRVNAVTNKVSSFMNLEIGAVTLRLRLKLLNVNVWKFKWTFLHVDIVNYSFGGLTFPLLNRDL